MIRVSRGAQFDLDCPRSEIQYTNINEKMIGAQCGGKRTKYVKVCRQKVGYYSLDEECQWVQN